MAVVAPFPSSTPEAEGIPTDAILGFVDGVERQGLDLHGMVLLRHGAVVAEHYWEPYASTYRHMLFSLSKSFTSTAVGLAVGEGRLSIDDHVLDFFPDEAPPNPDARLRAMRVRHLLTMTSGHDPEPPRSLREGDENWARGFLGTPLAHDPGTHFVYNSLATYMLSAIVQKLTGQRILDYLGPRIFEPLGIEGPTWQQSPQGIDTGGWGLSVRTPDIARFGQLYLQRGIWQGKRLIAEEWVAQATSRQVPNGPSENPDWEQGYGFQFWRCRHDAYRGDGMYGQFCVVMPDHDAVLAITSGVNNMQAVLDQVWASLLPAMRQGTLPADSAADARLADRLTPRVGSTAASPLAAEISGRGYALEENPIGVTGLGFTFSPDGGSITIRAASGDQPARFAYGRWVVEDGVLASPRGDGMQPAKVGGRAEWQDGRTLAVQICWPETPYRLTLTCRFEGDQVLVDEAMNVPFAPEAPKGLVGRAV